MYVKKVFSFVWFSPNRTTSKAESHPCLSIWYFDKYACNFGQKHSTDLKGTRTMQSSGYRKIKVIDDKL